MTRISKFHIALSCILIIIITICVPYIIGSRQNIHKSTYKIGKLPLIVDESTMQNASYSPGHYIRIETDNDFDIVFSEDTYLGNSKRISLITTGEHDEIMVDNRIIYCNKWAVSYRCGTFVKSGDIFYILIFKDFPVTQDKLKRSVSSSMRLVDKMKSGSSQ